VTEIEKLPANLQEDMHMLLHARQVSLAKYVPEKKTLQIYCVEKVFAHTTRQM
jgi:hypothetical protein